MRRLLVMALVGGVVAAGCGGGTTDAPPGTTSVRAFDSVASPPALVVAEAAVEHFGDDLTAALAILLALDRGYDVAQIVEAIASGTLTAAGGVVVDGTVVAPAGTAADLIADKGPADATASSATVLAMDFLAGAAVTVEELQGYLGMFDGFVTEALTEPPSASTQQAPDAEVERNRNVAMTLTLLDLADVGFTAEQIIQSVIFGEIECAWVKDDFEVRMSIQMGLFSCAVGAQQPQGSAHGVLARPEPTDDDQVEPVVEPGDPDIVDGVYETMPTPNLIEAFQQELVEGQVTLVVSGGEYRLTMRAVVTSVHGRCTAVSTAEYDAPGVRFPRTNYISFHGDFTRTEVDCPRGEVKVTTNEDFGATVWIGEEGTLTVHLPGGFGRDLPLTFVED